MEFEDRVRIGVSPIMTSMVFAMEKGGAQERRVFATKKDVWSREWLRVPYWYYG